MWLQSPVSSCIRSSRSLGYAFLVSELHPMAFRMQESMTGMLTLLVKRITTEFIRNRSMILLNQEKRMITMRHDPRLSLITTTLNDDGSISLTAPDMDPLTFKLKLDKSSDDDTIAFTCVPYYFPQRYRLTHQLQDLVNTDGRSERGSRE